MSKAFKALFEKMENVLNDLKRGKMIVIIDDRERENEGDIAMAGEKVTGRAINFFIKECRGLVCVAMERKRLIELDLPQMVKDNQDSRRTKFAVSVDAKDCKTGISAFERAKTIKLLADPRANKSDFSRPGHVFPLEYEENGIMERAGHTEAMMELLKLANMTRVGVICEIIREDGKMARKKDLLLFSQKFNCRLIEIKDIIKYLKALKHGQV